MQVSLKLSLSGPSQFSAEKKKKKNFRKFYSYFSFYARDFFLSQLIELFHRTFFFFFFFF